MEKLFIETSDKKRIVIQTKYAKMCKTIANVIEDCVDNDTPIPLQVTEKTFQKVLDFCEHYEGDTLSSEEYIKTRGWNLWEIEFFRVSGLELLEMIKAANYLDLPLMVQLSCLKVAQDLRQILTEDIPISRYFESEEIIMEEIAARRDAAKGQTPRLTSTQQTSQRKIKGEGHRTTEGNLDNVQYRIEQSLDFSGRFRVLQKYFEDITREDLQLITKKDVLDGVQSKHKLLTVAFLKHNNVKLEKSDGSQIVVINHDAHDLQNVPHEENAFGEFHTVVADTQKNEPYELILKGESIDMAGKMYPKRFNGFCAQVRNMPTDMLPSLLLDLLSTVPKSTLPDEKTHLELNLSSNDLFHEDAEEIANAMTRANEEFPHCRFTLLMHLNRFDEKSAKAFKNLLDLDNVAFVSCWGNPLASMDCKEVFFDSLHGKDYRKLIFLPQHWIKATTWHTFVGNKLVEQIEITHRRFYRLNK